MKSNFFVYLFVCAMVTYLIRMIPFVLVKNKIKNKFLLSFLYYIPYAVLSVMIVPAVFFSTGERLSAICAFVVACIMSFFSQSLLRVSVVACIVVFIVERFL